MGERTKLCVRQVPSTGQGSASGRQLLPAGVQGPSAGWLWGRACGGVGSVSLAGGVARGRRDPGNFPRHPVLGIWLCSLQGFQNPVDLLKSVPTSAKQSVMFLASRILVSSQCQPFSPWGAGREAESTWVLQTLWRPGQRRAVSWRVKGHIGLWLNVTEGSCSLQNHHHCLLIN